MSDHLIRSLRDENARLREEVVQLRAALSECEPLPQEWRLSPLETRVFGVLVRRPCASFTAIMTALYSDRADADVIDDQTAIRCYVCKIRRKLTPFGITITTRRGHGYALDPATRARFAGAVQPTPRIAA